MFARGILAVAGLALAGLFMSSPVAAQFAPGTMLVTDAGTFQRVIAIDPATGDRTVVSGLSRGTGTNFVAPAGIALDASGNILVADRSQGLFSVDPVTGDRTRIASWFNGAGPGLITSEDLVALPNGDIFVADSSYPGIIRFNPNTLEREVVSGPLFAGNLQVGEVGSGPTFNNPTGIAMDAAGNLVVTDPEIGSGNDRVMIVDPATGNRTVLSDQTGIGAGPTFAQPNGVAIAANGDLFVTDLFDDALFRIDPLTGDRAIVSDDNNGTGTSLNFPTGVAFDLGGGILVADQAENAIFAVDPISGDRVEVSGPNVGSGPSLVDPSYLVVVPEPGSAALFACAGLAFARRRRR
ncbi:MAG: NHL repeat-containing protein [Phycisphaeraceae bacterium]